MKVFKQYFLGRLMREKALLLGFVALIVAFWAVSFKDRFGQFRRRFSETSNELQQQQLVLDSRERIEKASKQAISRLDPAKTLDSLKLHAEVVDIAQQAGITQRMDDPKNDSSNYFNVHSIRIRITKVDYATLVRFYMELEKRAPYIGIEQFSLQSDQNPAQLTAQIRLSSVEVLH